MGYFSFITQDTKESISHVNPKTVYMIDDRGNQWEESNYEGFGVFGGKDYYELLAEMNGLQSGRELAISKVFNSDDILIHPNLYSNPGMGWVDSIPKVCPNQGFSDEEYAEIFGW